MGWTVTIFNNICIGAHTIPSEKFLDEFRRRWSWDIKVAFQIKRSEYSSALPSAAPERARQRQGQEGQGQGRIPVVTRAAGSRSFASERFARCLYVVCIRLLACLLACLQDTLHILIVFSISPLVGLLHFPSLTPKTLSSAERGGGAPPPLEGNRPLQSRDLLHLQSGDDGRDGGS